MTAASARTKAKRKRAAAQRQRIRAGGEVDTPRIAPVRLAEGAVGRVVAAEWRDPADLNPRSRQPAKVSGHRAYDPIVHLREIGSITRGQAAAAVRLRKAYELGILQQHGTVDWGSTPGSNASGPGCGPAEIVLQHAERFRMAQTRLGRLFDILQFVCLEEQTVLRYALARGLNRGIAMGMLLSSLCALQDHWDTIDEPAKRAARGHPAPMAAAYT